MARKSYPKIAHKTVCNRWCLTVCGGHDGFHPTYMVPSMGAVSSGIGGGGKQRCLSGVGGNGSGDRMARRACKLFVFRLVKEEIPSGGLLTDTWNFRGMKPNDRNLVGLLRGKKNIGEIPKKTRGTIVSHESRCEASESFGNIGKWRERFVKILF